MEQAILGEFSPPSPSPVETPRPLSPRSSSPTHGPRGRWREGGTLQGRCSTWGRWGRWTVRGGRRGKTRPRGRRGKPPTHTLIGTLMGSLSTTVPNDSLLGPPGQQINSPLHGYTLKSCYNCKNLERAQVREQGTGHRTEGPSRLKTRRRDAPCLR